MTTGSGERLALRRMLKAIYEEMPRPAAEAVRSFAPGGRVPPQSGGTGTTQGAEPPLGNPPTDGYHLASTVAGVRSWEAPAAAGGATVLDSVSGTAPIVAGPIVAKNQAISITPATPSAAGSLSPADKAKLNAMTGAGTDTHTVAGTAPASPVAGDVWLDTAATAADMATQAELDAAIATRQPLDADLTTIAGLTATTDSFLQAKSSAWAARTIAQVKADLGLPTVLLDYKATTDLAAGTTIAATWANLGPNHSFTVQRAGTVVAIAVGGHVGGLRGGSDVGTASRIRVDSAGTPIDRQLGGQLLKSTSYVNFLAGAAEQYLTGLVAGAHTVQVQLYAQADVAAYCRAGSEVTESLRVTVVEFV